MHICSHNSNLFMLRDNSIGLSPGQLTQHFSKTCPVCLFIYNTLHKTSIFTSFLSDSVSTANPLGTLGVKLAVHHFLSFSLPRLPYEMQPGGNRHVSRRRGNSVSQSASDFGKIHALIGWRPHIYPSGTFMLVVVGGTR